MHIIFYLLAPKRMFFVNEILTFANCLCFITSFSLSLLIPTHSDYINEVLHENPEDDMKQAQSDWDEGGLTFIAKSSRK